VRSYGRQLFVALLHMHKSGYVHSDVKPDNILIGGEHNKRTLLKVRARRTVRSPLSLPSPPPHCVSKTPHGAVVQW
jgi:serine/threonine protein kinase